MWQWINHLVRRLFVRDRETQPTAELEYLESEEPEDVSYTEPAYPLDELIEEQADVRPSIWVNIKLEEEGFASDAEVELRYNLENAIEERGIGDWYGSGSGDDWMDVAFIVKEGDTVQSAVTAVRQLLRELNVPDDRVRLDIFDD